MRRGGKAHLTNVTGGKMTQLLLFFSITHILDVERPSALSSTGTESKANQEL